MVSVFFILTSHWFTVFADAAHLTTARTRINNCLAVHTNLINSFFLRKKKTTVTEIKTIDFSTSLGLVCFEACKWKHKNELVFKHFKRLTVLPSWITHDNSSVLQFRLNGLKESCRIEEPKANCCCSLIQ